MGLSVVCSAKKLCNSGEYEILLVFLGILLLTRKTRSFKRLSLVKFKRLCLAIKDILNSFLLILVALSMTIGLILENAHFSA